MASDLITIAASGARAARAALDVTANNVANASTAGYVRRTVNLEEVAAARGGTVPGDLSLAGVRVAGIGRNADAFRQAEARRTGSDTARADTELSGLKNIETGVENAGIFDSITGFEAALKQLGPDPTNPSLRAAVLGAARSMAGTFQLAGQELTAAGNTIQFELGDGINQVNDYAKQLAQTNLRIVAAGAGTTDRSALYDSRDLLLSKIAGLADIATTFAPDGTVQLQLGGNAGPVLVSGGTASTLASTPAANGTPQFTVGGNAVALSGGSLAGYDLALGKLASVRSDVDALASSVIATVNTAQANGTDLAGNPGQPLLAGTGAASFTVVASNGSAIATAPAGAAAGSRNAGNLVALQNALATGNPSGTMDAILFDISATVASRQSTRNALATISDNAATALAAQTGVDLDQEAVNLVKFQQAFQASSKVIQVASSLFDSLLAIR